MLISAAMAASKMKRASELLAFAGLLRAISELPSVRAAEPGTAVVVIYNSRLPESKRVAEHYALRRQVPANQVLGFDMTITETMTRAEFINHLQSPLLHELEARKLFTLASSTVPATNGHPKT